MRQVCPHCGAPMYHGYANTAECRQNSRQRLPGQKPEVRLAGDALAAAVLVAWWE
ncbi:MAG: hypothetical protein ACLT29_01300 [Ruminococcus callidus]